MAATNLRTYSVSRDYLSSPVTNTRSQPDGKLRVDTGTACLSPGMLLRGCLSSAASRDPGLTCFLPTSRSLRETDLSGSAARGGKLDACG